MPDGSATAHHYRPKFATVLSGDYDLGCFRRDLLAALTVAIVALPLSMAIAVASGVSPERGLYAAVVGGFLVSALGGSRYQIGGPAGAFIVLVTTTVARYGLDGLLLTVFMSGFMLMLIGLLRLGALIRYIPDAVTVGFTGGIAVTIFASQLRDLGGLKLPAAEPGPLLPKLAMIGQSLPTITLAALALGVGSAVLIFLLRRIVPNWPGMLIAVVLASVAAWLFGLPVETIGSRFGQLPGGLPSPRLPPLSFQAAIEVLPTAISFTLLGAVESLLSAKVADGMTGRKHRYNMEMVAQGIANIASAMFGGISVTGTIARTATNIRAGACSPVSGMAHALIVLVFMLVAAPLAGFIPLSALAGVLVVVCWNMVEKEEAVRLLHDWSSAAILITTFGLTVIEDLTFGISAGCALAAAFAFARRWRATRGSFVARVKELIFMSRLTGVPQLRKLGESMVAMAQKRVPALMRPIVSLRRTYLPVLMVYFAYGSLGIIDVSRDMWIKERLTLTPAELAGIGVWLSLPWTVKMVFGQLVDSVPIFGSQRRSYILIGAVFTACGLLTLAGAAGGWIAFSAIDRLYILGAMLIVVGTVIQDVVADAMSTEVVSRVDPAGNVRPESEFRTELGMVQVLGRLALGIGILSVAGLSGWLAQFFAREAVFLLGLVIPAISASGVLLIRSESSERRPLDWRILGGGIGFGLIVLAVGIGGLPFAQEFVFVLSMGVICTMLFFVTRELDATTRRSILFASIIIFAFRATPSVGDGYFWWTLDVLKFDEAFYGSLRQTAAIIAIVAMWTFSKQLTEYSATRVLLWLAVAGAILSLPNIGLFFGLHHWTEQTLGIGARGIAVIDAAAGSPFAQLSMIPVLTLIAFYAPAGHRATWFALMASLMNLALVAGQLQTKYLNEIFVVQRGEYSELGPLLITATMLGLVLPIGVILLFGRRS